MDQGFTGHDQEPLHHARQYEAGAYQIPSPVVLSRYEGFEIKILDQGETIADRRMAQSQRSPYNGQTGGADGPTPGPSIKCTATIGTMGRAFP